MRNMDQLEASLDAVIKPGNLKDAMSGAAASSGYSTRCTSTKASTCASTILSTQRRPRDTPNLLCNHKWLTHKPMARLGQRDESSGTSRVYIFGGHRRLLVIPLANLWLVNPELFFIQH